MTILQLGLIHLSFILNSIKYFRTFLSLVYAIGDQTLKKHAKFPSCSISRIIP